MTESRYKDNIIKAPMMKSVVFPQISHTQAFLFGGEHFKKLGGTSFTMNWSYLTRPFVMVDEKHTHDYDQVICFLGGDPEDITQFGAEIEMCFGMEEEKQLINFPAFIFVPKGLVHGPLIIRKVDQPIMYMDFTQTPFYHKSNVSGNPSKF
ncbi:MAG TPA: hypothetical protein VLH15_11620 [Dehalococcoidales bacterium]|nr:hypothetical protein [Dehalococcoidales bacterium]